MPDSASASPFGYAADSPLDRTDPTGHYVTAYSGPLTPAQQRAEAAQQKASISAAANAGARQAAAAARTAPLDAHQLHLLHLARLAATGQAAKAAPTVKPPTLAQLHQNNDNRQPDDPSAFTPCPALGNSCLALTHENNQNRQDAEWYGPVTRQTGSPGRDTLAPPTKSAPAKHATPVDSPRPPSGGNPLSGVKSLIGAGATALLSGIVGGGASISEAEINALLGTSGTEGLAKLQSAIGDLANMSPSDLAQFLKPKEVAAVQKIGAVWFARVVYGHAAERAVAAALTDVPEIVHLGNSQVFKRVADFYVIGENAAIPFDLTGPSASAVGDHLKRWFVGSASQVLTYARPADTFLKSMFGI